MYRFAQNDLLHWFKSKNRKPLILRGARQVGKSTLVRKFAEAEKLDLFEVNIEESPLKSLKRDEYDVTEVIKEIEFRNKKKITANSIIFLDEIQDQPRAINLLRYFFEKKSHFAIIAAGSLLESVIENEKIDIPVGRVDFYHLGPMTFKEYLLGIEENQLIEYLNLKDIKQIPEFIHLELLKQVKNYYLIGGMPEAILTYRNTSDINEVNKVQYQLLETYHSDFFKYASRGKIPKIEEVFNYIPNNLGKKIKYAEISREYKSKDLQTAIHLLTIARIITPVYFAKGNVVPLASTCDHSIFKVFFLDIGLVSKINNVSIDFLYDEKFSVFLKGNFAEQFVFQHLFNGNGKFESRPTYYWLNNKKNSEAELDFFYETKKLIVPIEVKAGSASSLKSLIYFMHVSGLKLAIKISSEPYKEENINTKIFDGKQQVDVSFRLLTIPFYLVGSHELDSFF